MKDEHLGQLNQHVAHLRFRLFVAAFAGVQVVDRVLCVVVLQALGQRGFVLQRLSHERIARH